MLLVQLFFVQGGGVGGEVASGAVVPHVGFFAQQGAEGVELFYGEVIHDGVAAVGKLEMDGGAAWFVMKIE